MPGLPTHLFPSHKFTERPRSESQSTFVFWLRELPALPAPRGARGAQPCLLLSPKRACSPTTTNTRGLTSHMRGLVTHGGPGGDVRQEGALRTQTSRVLTSRVLERAPAVGVCRDARGPPSLRCPAARGTRTPSRFPASACASWGCPGHPGAAVRLRTRVSLHGFVAEYKNQYILKESFTEDKISSWAGWQWFDFFVSFVFYYYIIIILSLLWSVFLFKQGTRQCRGKGWRKGRRLFWTICPDQSKDTQS